MYIYTHIRMCLPEYKQHVLKGTVEKELGIRDIHRRMLATKLALVQPLLTSHEFIIKFRCSN